MHFGNWTRCNLAAFFSAAIGLASFVNGSIVISGTSTATGAGPESATDLINQGQPTFGSSTPDSGVTDPGFGGYTSLNDGALSFGFGDTLPLQVTFNLDLTFSPLGYDLTKTQFVTLSSGDARRIQVTQVEYELKGSSTFTSLTAAATPTSPITVSGGQATYDPGAGHDGYTTIADSLGGNIASGVQAVRLTIYSNNSAGLETGFNEFDVFGSPVPEPASASLVAFAGSVLLARRRRD